LQVAPPVIYVRDGRAFLAGMERASFMDLSSAEEGEVNRLIAADANALARVLAPLAALPDATAPDVAGEEPTTGGLPEIVAHGQAGEFASPTEVAGACSVALQSAEQLLSLLHVETPPAQVELVAGSATSVGRVRVENQDACANLVIELRDDYGSGSP